MKITALSLFFPVAVLAHWPHLSRETPSPRAELNGPMASRSLSTDAETFSKAEYDFVIIGGGTAGLALAGRLSEGGTYSVGVLEAGISGQGVPIIDMPGDYGADVGTVYDCELTFG